jgi:hypothetical protein
MEGRQGNADFGGRWLGAGELLYNKLYSLNTELEL